MKRETVNSLSDSERLMRSNFGRTLESLDGLFGFIDKFMSDNGIGESTVFAVSLAAEEIFVNMVKHNPGGTDDISIELSVAEDKLVIQLIDPDARFFDPSEVKTPDSDRVGEDLSVGGRGIHLAKSVMDEVNYDYEHRTCRVTMTKWLEKSDV